MPSLLTLARRGPIRVSFLLVGILELSPRGMLATPGKVVRELLLVLPSYVANDVPTDDEMANSFAFELPACDRRRNDALARLGATGQFRRTDPR